MIEPARTEELAPAFRLIFQHLAEEESELRVANALELLRQGSLPREGVLVARGQAGLLGAIVCVPLPAAGGIMWPPRVVEHPRRLAIEDQLVQRAGDFLRQRGTKLAQALLAPDDVSRGAPLARNGFRNITRLWYMRHHLEVPAPLWNAKKQLSYQSYANCDQHLFHETLLRTYEDTLDCPEINGVRAIAEVIEGHKHQGEHDPEHWWLALENGVAVGVLLTTRVPDSDGWDLAYLGVAPAARGHGVGREMTLKALWECKAADATQLTLSVDARNLPAWNLYRGVGFEPYDQREVFLAVWGRCAD